MPRSRSQSPWPKISEKRIPNASNQAPGLSGEYDIVIPTDILREPPKPAFVPKSTRHSAKSGGVGSGSRLLRRRSKKCFSCELLSKSTNSKDQREREPTCFPAVTSGDSRSSAAEAKDKGHLPKSSPRLHMANSTRLPLPTVSLPKNPVSSRRGLLGIHLTPDVPQTPEYVPQFDLGDREGQRNLTQQVILRSSADVTSQPQETHSHRADACSLTTVDHDIRASSCMLHVKNDKPTREKTLMYSTTRHGSVYTQYQKRLNCGFQREPMHEASPRADFDPRDSKEKDRPTRGLPVLPQDLPPDEFVVTWLVHGSAPRGESHFPDILS